MAATSVPSEEIRAATFQRLYPKTYLERFLQENVRPDGRDFLEFRDCSINVGSISTADGSSLVRLGDTTVVCGVKAEIAEPDLDAPEDGFLVPNLDLPPLCSPKYKPGPPSDDAQVISSRLNEALILSGMLPTKSLCIQPGKFVWVLYVDATCINYNGNVFDATLLAMVAALKNARLPKAVYHEETNHVTCSRKLREPLSLSGTPLASTFGVFDSSHLLADPTAFEEPLLETTVTIITDNGGRLLSTSQLGQYLPPEMDVLSECITNAKSRTTEIMKHILAI
ncbi:ribosomal protein S5 domain 2-like protein [Thelephora terrestris]|uniref:Ribosomal RNA-processing protein 43 n=1 Tax=Thelephora terrestris TaxID=56493 RepID=A0A9P6HAN7_9AGAM|nr:ribosomal protein S5 domain 2-like protein [Thelephora terrestris]